MPYVLGIDLGGTRTTVAVSHWEGDGWSRPDVVRLADETCHVPSVLHVAADGTLAVGDPTAGAAVPGDRTVGTGYGSPDPGSISRGFTRRIGDDVPLAVGAEVWTAEALTAVLVRWLVGRVTAQLGGPPEQIVVSHPAAWGGYRRDLLHHALWEIGLTRVALLPEPVMAAESQAARGFTGHTLAVYSLAEEEFGAAVVRRTPVGFELLGQLAGSQPLGAADFDEALARHALDHLREREAMDPPATRASLPNLIPACAQARQRLTVATETDIRLRLPAGPIRVPVSRAGFEQLVRPALRLTVETLVRVVRAAAPHPEQLDGVLLVGAAARTPLVAELVAARLPVPVTVETEPAVTVALGAAWAAAQIVSPSRRPAVEAGRAGTRSERLLGQASRLPASRPDRPAEEPTEPPARPPVRISPLELPRGRAAALSSVGAGGRASWSRTRS